MNPTFSNKETLDIQSQECTPLINKSKDRYLAKMNAKLDNPKSIPKTYWSIINKFLSNRKIPIMPPILVNGELISDLKQKSNISYNHFTFLCSPIKSGSKLPNFSYKTKKRLRSFDIKDDVILLIIRNLNVNKAHGRDRLSIRMIKACGNSISLPLKL